MAYVDFDHSAPCGFLICRNTSRSKHLAPDVLIQTDWDFPGVASTMGWRACKCGGTDGTVDCVPCGRTAGEMISEAYDYIREREGKRIPALDAYLECA